MAEDVNGQILAGCHQCGRPFDSHKNCANNACHLLFIQCPQCAAQYDNCCSNECKDEYHNTTLNPSKLRMASSTNNKYRKSMAMKLKEKTLALEMV